MSPKRSTPRHIYNQTLKTENLQQQEKNSLFRTREPPKEWKWMGGKQTKTLESTILPEDGSYSPAPPMRRQTQYEGSWTYFQENSPL